MEQTPEVRISDVVDLQTIGLNNQGPLLENFQNVVYPQIFKFRKEQLARGIDISNLTYTQMGLQSLEKCHHISNTQTIKDGIPSFRVRVCKTCCQSDGHIELGTYVDQESAIIVNDTHEILQNRFSKLACLRPEDKQYLHLLTARKFDRHNGEENVSVLNILAERNSISSRSRSKNQLRYRRHIGSSSVETDSYSESDNKSNYSNSDESLVETISQNNTKDIQHSKFSPNIDNDSNIPRTANEVHPYVSQCSSSTPNSFETDDIYAAHVLTTLSFSGSHQTSPPPTLMNTMLFHSNNSNTNGRLTFKWKRKHESDASPLPHDEDDPDHNDEINDVANTLTSLPLAFTYESRMNTPPPPPATSAGGSSSSTSSSLIISIPPPTPAAANNNNNNNRNSIHNKSIYSNTRARSNSTSMLSVPCSYSYPYPSNHGNNGSSGNRRLRADTIADVQGESLNYLYNGRERGSGSSAIGCYSPNSRKKRIEKFQEKRKHRVWTKKVKYDVRKNFADSRVRIKGRFVKKSEEYLASSGSGTETGTGTANYSGNENQNPAANALNPVNAAAISIRIKEEVDDDENYD